MITKHANACIYFDERAITAWVARSTFDAEQRLTGCDRIYRRIYELPERLVQPGTPFTEIVHHFLEKEAGVAHHEVLDAREWIARHLEQLALGKSPAHIHFLRDGRVIVVRNQLLPKGGWAEFELKFQPIINLAQNQVVSSEALIRWRKPDVGLVLPAEFIPLAEETGLIAAGS